ncbi:response regulator [Rheinheimera sp. D18]|uniref:response regulator n=1 Tax=Rheinheimera sp. D18 TaxID=2545632 RepID=UPI001046EB75|nr:hybrid sensor histidine kinase/response regulator [Rheinheimera sp. D18]QBL10148.1 response regulator [Rheinheimera sp. D18]
MLPWLIALIAMASFIGLWFKFEAETQQHIQIEQMAAMLQSSIQPLLKTKDTELLKAQLNNLRYTSAVPLNAIAIYNQQHQVLVTTDAIGVVKNFTYSQPVHSFSIQSYANQLLALQPLNTQDVTNGSKSSNAYLEPHYLLLVFEPVIGLGDWLPPIGIVGLIGLVVLMMLQKHLMQLAQRQHTDVSLIVHKLNQLCHGQLNVKLNEELVPELVILKPALNRLSQYQSEIIIAAEQTNQQLQQQLEQVQQQCEQIQQQYSALQLQCSSSEQLIQNRLFSLQQIRQHAELSDNELTEHLLAQIRLLKLELGTAKEPPQQFKLSTFLADQRSVLQQLCSSKAIELQLFETADNLSYEISFSSAHLAMLLVTMAQIASRAKSVSDLTLRVQLKVSQSDIALHLSITGNGDGISSRIRQLLAGDDTRSLQWHESDVGILIVLMRQLQASLTIQSLEGLGCTIALVLPVTDAVALVPTKVPHLLLCDQQHASLVERAEGLTPLAEQLAQCTNLAELERAAKQFSYDTAVIMLPEPAELSQWREQLQWLSRQPGRVLCYASAAQLPVWREALQLEVRSNPFCLDDLRLTAPTTPSHPSLLVVDDNATNLAFVQVLLKDQPVQLYTASCGIDALKLCQQYTFDTILLDIQLPDIAGTEVAKQLRQLPAYLHTPILAFTAHALEEEVNAFVSAGMNDVIFKPLEATKLDLILRWCLIGKANNTDQ